MLKQSGKPKLEDQTIPAQPYNMDLSFMSGPLNLTDMLKFNATPKKSITNSRDGHIEFLIIINVASRHLQTHPVKSKDQPIKFIDAFLKKHGIKNKNLLKVIKITTTKDGYVASSRASKLPSQKKKCKLKQSLNQK